MIITYVVWAFLRLPYSRIRSGAIKVRDAAGPEYFEDYFQKGALLCQKSALNRLYHPKFAKTVAEHLMVCHIWLIKFK